MFDLMAVAYEADITRVFSFMLNREASQLVFPNLGFNEPWHHVSHHGNAPEKLELLVKLNTWQIELFGKFLQRLQDTPDGDGSLLDHSTLLWGSGMSESNAHSPLDVPYLMVGKAAGAFTGNRHLVAPKGTPAGQRDADGGAALWLRDGQVRRQHRRVRAVGPCDQRERETSSIRLISSALKTREAAGNSSRTWSTVRALAIGATTVGCASSHASDTAATVV